jgi:hypothetical protein
VRKRTANYLPNKKARLFLERRKKMRKSLLVPLLGAALSLHQDHLESSKTLFRALLTD